MNCLIPFHIHQNFNLIELLMCKGTMFTGLLSKILIFNAFLLIPMMNTMTSSFTFVLSMQISLNIMSTIFSHINFFKYHNVVFNLNNVTTIQSVPSLVGYLLASLNIRSLTTHSIPICQLVPLSKHITNYIFLKWMCIVMTNLLQILPYILTHLPLIMVLHATIYFLAQSHWFQMYILLK